MIASTLLASDGVVHIEGGLLYTLVFRNHHIVDFTMSASAETPLDPIGFLAIFRPSYDRSSQEVQDRIVYYASISTENFSHKQGQAASQPGVNAPDLSRSEQLRHIRFALRITAPGLEIFKNDNLPHPSNTDDFRVILHEPEPGWRILAAS